MNLSFSEASKPLKHHVSMLSSPLLLSTTPRRRATGVALQTRPVPHQREIVALGAGLAGVTLHPRLGAFVGDARDQFRLSPCELGQFARLLLARFNVALQRGGARGR